VNDALVLMQSVADTAGALHESGYVHRDLKPANILLDQYNTPKVADFGLVKSLDEVTRLTASGLVCGTPAYMAPEQARGEGQAINPRSDVWALGAVLYELLTSKPPFQAENALRLMLKITKESPQPPQELNPRIPREVSLIVLKCLEKNPDRRYPNGRALAADLQRFLSGQPVQARSTSVTRMLRGASAYRKPAALVAAGLLVAALAVMLARWFFVAPDPQALAESGWQSWNAQKTAEAETRFQQALKLDPLNGRAGIGLGLIRATACLDLQTGRVINPQGFREAIELMQKAGEDDPRVADLAAHWCAKLHHKAGNLVEEVRMRERAVRFCPDNPDYRQCLGLAYWNFAASLILRDQPAKRKECLERAVTEFNAVLKINPNYPQTRGYIAKIQEQWLSRNASAVSSAAPRRPL
jgi:tetratricopeptide (TPR) repeat protein